MTPEEARLAAQSALYDEVLESPVTSHVVDYLCRTQMLLRIADGEFDTVHSVLYTDAGREAALREYEQLSDDERKEVHETVAQHWSLNVNLAVRKLWHAAEVLGFRGDTLDPKHVAMTAATYFSMPADDLVDELTKATK
jgi:hypothetical protein